MINEGYFYNAIKRDISMVKGDTLAFGFQVQGLGGQRPSKIFFTAKERVEDEAPLFIVSLNDTIDEEAYDDRADILSYTVRVPPGKTENIPLGRYFYDLEIEVNGDIITLMIGRITIEYEIHDSDTPITPSYTDGDDDLNPLANIPSGQKKIYTVEYISAIGSAINSVKGLVGVKYTTAQMADAVRDIVNYFPEAIDEVVFPRSEEV